MARKIYYTSKGQPYIKLASGRAKFISKRSAGMSDVGNPKKRSRKSMGSVAVGYALVGLGEIKRLAKETGKCITIITSKGVESSCPTQARKTSVRKKKRARK
jgi:hypothetical protein